MASSLAWDPERVSACVDEIAARLRGRLSAEQGGMDEWFARLGRNSLSIEPSGRRSVVTVRAPAPHAAWIRAYWLPTLEKMVARALGVEHGDIRVILTAAPRGDTFRRSGPSSPELDGIRRWPDLDGVELIARDNPLLRFYSELDQRREAGERMSARRVLEIYDPCKGLLECLYCQFTTSERRHVTEVLDRRFRTPPPGLVDRQVLHETVKSLRGIPAAVRRGRLRTKPYGTVPSSAMVLRVSSKWHGVSVEEMMSQSRQSVVVFSRITTFHLLRRVTHQTQTQIARFFGRDHTTVGYAESKAFNMLKGDRELRAGIEALARECDRVGLEEWATNVAANYNRNLKDPCEEAA